MLRQERTPGANGRSLGLDAMRSGAILLVLAAHWSNNILFWFGVTAPRQLAFTGTLGVEVFFALSGFLIGQILIEQASTNPGWRNFGVFLVRRWMRTLPLYFSVLAVLLVFFPPPELPLRYALKFGSLTQNLFRPMPPGWWFSVSWSLAVEEWFYLLFGAAVFASYRMFRADWAIWPPVGLFILVPLGLRFGAPGFSPWSGGLSQMVFFRLDEIAYGVAMAAFYRRRVRLFDRPLACLAAGLVLIVVVPSTHVPTLAWLFRPLSYNITIIGCALLLPAALRLRRLPGPLAAAVGAISAQSYALYLIHLTLLVDVAQALWVRHWVPVWGCVAIATIAPFVLSWLSARFLEAPILCLHPAHPRAKAGTEPTAPLPAPPQPPQPAALVA